MGEKMKKEDYKRQLIIANSLYELGIDEDVIKTITTISKSDLEKYREEVTKNVDKKNDNNI